MLHDKRTGMLNGTRYWMLHETRNGVLHDTRHKMLHETRKECYMTKEVECYMTQEKECYMTQGMDCFMTWRAKSSISRYKELHAAFYYLYRTVSPRSKVVARYKVHPTYSKIIRVNYEILNNDNILSFLSKMIISGHIFFGKRPW